jgi:hypothetical protein
MDYRIKLMEDLFQISRKYSPENYSFFEEFWMNDNSVIHGYAQTPHEVYFFMELKGSTEFSNIFKFGEKGLEIYLINHNKAFVAPAESDMKFIEFSKDEIDKKIFKMSFDDIIDFNEDEPEDLEKILEIVTSCVFTSTIKVYLPSEHHS